MLKAECTKDNRSVALICLSGDVIRTDGAFPRSASINRCWGKSVMTQLPLGCLDRSRLRRQVHFARQEVNDHMMHQFGPYYVLKSRKRITVSSGSFARSLNCPERGIGDFYAPLSACLCQSRTHTLRLRPLRTGREAAPLCPYHRTLLGREGIILRKHTKSLHAIWVHGPMNVENLPFRPRSRPKASTVRSKTPSQMILFC